MRKIKNAKTLGADLKNRDALQLSGSVASMGWLTSTRLRNRLVDRSSVQS
ncbi:hypothetical protein [Mesorhizobium sp. WSM4884]|nr:hypothetical protein [Mesorhizobium sp. WSM4884]MDG4881169.1 hypothetical protein [Mesorhizobium sp. WSM4884]